MGQALTIPRHLWVRIPATYLQETFCVERTSGLRDPDWRIVGSDHPCGHVGVIEPSATKHSPNGLWHLYVYNGHDDPNMHRCAWKRIEKIEPMSLNGNQTAIREWRKTLIEQLEVEEARRAMNELTRDLNLIRL